MTLLRLDLSSSDSGNHYRPPTLGSMRKFLTKIEMVVKLSEMPYQGSKLINTFSS